MSKELPYFKFVPQEWVNGNVTLCSMEAQGLFVNLICLYWSKDCSISLAKAKQRFSNSQLFDELINEEVFVIDEEENIIISFLDEQMEKFINVSEVRSKAGSKGGKAKAKQMPSKCKANANIEEKRRGEKKREEKLEFWSSHISDSFKSTFNDYVEMRKTMKPKMTDKAIQLAISKLDKHDELTAIKMLENSIMNSWKGLFELKDNKQQKPQSNMRANMAQFLAEEGVI